MKRFPASVLFLSAPILGCREATPPPVTERAPEPVEPESGQPPSGGLVSVIQLLADPERHHGKLLLVYGVSVIGFEVNGVFASADLTLHSSNGVWISDLPAEYGDQTAEERWYLGCVGGTFDMYDGGHLSAWQGSIKNVYRFDATPIDPPTRPKLRK